MIQLNRNYSLPEREEEIIPIRVIGVGGAGSNALDRIVLDGMDKSDLIAANTDVQSLASSVAAVKVQLGRSITRGLGTGGDPELGFTAAEESCQEIEEALTDARLIFICTGLGGGTGSGAAPLIAEKARDMGALVIAFATMPFSFEGKRRSAQAQEALARLQHIADAVVCFENDRMGDMVAPKAGIHQAFAAADMTVSQSVRSIINVIQRPGLIRIGFDDLLAALRGGGHCLFGFGESDSDNRANDALTQALKNPLMDRGRMLAESSRVLVQIAGGPGMTLSEIEILMRELNKHIGDNTQLLFGTAVDGRMANRLSVTLISSLACRSAEAPVEPVVGPRITYGRATDHAGAKESAETPVSHEQPSPESPTAAPPFEPFALEEQQMSGVAQHATNDLRQAEQSAAEPESSGESQEPRTSESHAEAPMESRSEAGMPAPAVPPKQRRAGSAKFGMPQVLPDPELEQPRREKTVKQEVLQFEPVTRGRFEKSEPTIVEGQDLDVPTFLRKNVRVK